MRVSIQEAISSMSVIDAPLLDAGFWTKLTLRTPAVRPGRTTCDAKRARRPSTARPSCLDSRLRWTSLSSVTPSR
jgi:hypothetical protein